MNMPCHEDCCCDIGVIRKTLMENTGKVVTIFTESGGCSGEGFTGLVACVHDDACKVITTLPSGPAYPFEGTCRHGCNDNIALCRRCCTSHFGSAVYIPLCKIVACVAAEV